MIDSYFFIPGDKPKYLSKIDNIKADYLVFDLEDAVSINNKQLAIELILALTFSKNMFLRIPFFDNCYTTEQIKDSTEFDLVNNVLYLPTDQRYNKKEIEHVIACIYE